MQQPQDLNPIWRYNSRTVKCWKIDYRVFYFFILFIINIKAYMFWLLLGVGLVLWVMEFRYGYTLPALTRRALSFLSGKYKPAVSNRRRNRTDR